MPWQCFMLEPTMIARRALRRFTYGDDVACPNRPGWGHDASTSIENGEVRWSPDGTYLSEDDVPRDDLRWPPRCACGYAFTDDDHWQVWSEPLYRAPDGNLYNIGMNRPDSAPAGAMWDAPWYHDIPDWVGPDGRSLSVMLPDKTPWLIDGPSRSGGKWERSGDVPTITASPSIASKGYHGFLQSGVLTDDLEGRTYG